MAKRKKSAEAGLTVLTKGQVIKVSRPKNTQTGTTAEGTPFVLFTKLCYGGDLITYQILGEVEMFGKRYHGECTVLMDAEEKLFVQITPTPKGTRITHDCAMQNGARMITDEEAEHFAGYIIEDRDGADRAIGLLFQPRPSAPAEPAEN